MSYQSNQYNQGVPPPPQTQAPYGYSPQQGYGHAPPSGPPPGANPQLWAWFKAVDTDGSGQLTVDELQRALINGDWSPFNIETVRTMVNMFDTDNSGTINFNEFSGLWNYIEEWKKCFQTFDRDGSGSVDRNEMSQALRAFGFNVSDKFVHSLIQKFDRYGTNQQSRGNGNVTFDNFVQACVTVKTLTDSFRGFDSDQDGWIQINYEQFLDLVVRQRA
ncbi:uncharacterized protein BX664DRAFT_342232 [Halteromyces radiatus]|uniref:uncharacterized protein n=1 Tax=Halteromyces radiatus TaxID=101107 RepID=UPI002220EEC9|nr:uncharacterized protein BX664DRAFT_342232 [Halteromyces radiatus]KAI8080063.1 hypothetical protein BX664DRAFT_342232 [Halteromyces radiatus]